MDTKHDGSVAGMLLYAKTGEEFQPKNNFKMDGNKISVGSLNLNLPFGEIRNQLEKIVVDNFEEDYIVAKGDAYIGMTSYLEKCDSSSITMSFEEVKKINGDYLPMSAYKHNAWWSNSESHSQAFGWLNAGYRTANVDIASQKVTFQK